MADGEQHSMDGSSIKPVSSLRSHFENMTSIAPATSSPRDESPISQSPSTIQDGRSSGRTSLDLPRRDGTWESRGRFMNDRSYVPSKPPPNGLSERGSFSSSEARQRPLSMGPASPPRQTSSDLSSVRPGLRSGQPSPAIVPPRSTKPSYFQGAMMPEKPRNGSVGAVVPRRSSTPRVEPSRSPFLHPSEVENESERRLESIPYTSLGQTKQKMNPPMINRADKPRITRQESQLTATRNAPKPISVEINKASPFSTPPSSDDSPGIEFSSSFGKTNNNPAAAARLDRSLLPAKPDRTAKSESRTDQPPTIPYASRPKTAATISQSMNAGGATPRSAAVDIPENRPGLPPRRDISQPRPIPASRTHSRSPPKSVSLSSTPANNYVTANTSNFLPPPKRHPAKMPSRDLTASETSSAPLVRDSGFSTPNAESDEEENVVDMIDDEEMKGLSASSNGNYPDISQVNRRPPFFKAKVHRIDARHDTKIFAISGEHLCTTGHMTRIWSLKTGESIWAMLHDQEDGKVTSVAFKAARNLGNEGTQIWLGFNTGDIRELDIPMQRITVGRANAHKGSSVLKLFRYGKKMWSLDETRVLVWPTSEDGGTSDLRSQPTAFSIPGGHTFSMAVGAQLWIATGRDIWIYSPEKQNDNNSFQVLSRPLTQSSAGIVTSGTIVPSSRNLVYFGHMDGKVTLYDCQKYSCLGIFSISSYKINSMVGVGECLWAGYNNGAMSVINVKTTPWITLKEWKAHGDHPVLKLAVDSSSVWKMDCLQVASLGLENSLCLWDGFLEDDRLENDMHEHDVEYCRFNEIDALVLTWNAGASKPQDLRRDERDINFFRDLFSRYDRPEILVFGFQELVDLEAKRTTARSIFQSSKKKDASEPDHVGHQYREWRDHLNRVVSESTKGDESYYLLHSANLVGLFTCVFIKSTERSRVRGLDASTVRRGMGGLAGNKGALITRFYYDSSSLCFLNCHLAAGQNETPHRNKDVAAILDSSSLSADSSYSSRIDRFVGGGDGSMILDHEICILNGDLNYRIGSMPRSSVLKAISGRDLEKLLQRDQLFASRRRSPSFGLRSFVESPIEFSPTYKYDVGKDTYDTSSKARSPAWCDRILYRGKGKIKQLDYRRHEVHASDHRPVSGYFRLRVRNVLPRERQSVWEDCLQRLNVTRLRLIEDVKLDFLVNTCNVEINEAKRMLAAKKDGKSKA